jgi:hypothetical protein
MWLSAQDRGISAAGEMRFVHEVHAALRFPRGARRVHFDDAS